ncbi:E3 ubiquitin-protein ligase CCNB1IP1 isoform X1 [Halyomorpha halys]|uniref:E3 ubiquitin-protein ligase CCNB1IP1 isoform X1 n=1 Tax=Halyomorpha halys TaxID=286706 RepID=UPI0006D50B7A|nr:E3 ubiquitin-protein ligase CCNB1IP1-like [Halyomorpha halys]
MSDEYLFCNYSDCKAVITKFIWITRCSHVFCEEHGNSFFANNPNKIKCPVCNEPICRNKDIIKNNINPHDLMLSCVRPDKALDYVITATKLWSYQMKQKHKVNIQMLSEKYEKIASNSMSKLKTENNEMKKFIKEIEGEIKKINAELSYTKKKLWKYKLAYNNICMANQGGQHTHSSNNSLFQKFSADSIDDDIDDILQYRNLSHFDNLLSPKFN